MADKEGGQFVAMVKTVGKSESGKNWKVTTDKGVVNFAIKTFPKQPPLGIDEKYFFIWTWYDIPNTNNSMKMAQKYREVQDGDEDFDSRANKPEETEEGTGGGQKPTLPKPTVLSTGSDGMKFGNRLTNATNLTVAMITAGKCEATVDEIAKNMDVLFKRFDNAEQTGQFEIPF